MDNKPNYNPKDKNSVIGYAKLFKGKTLRQTCESQNIRTQLYRERKLRDKF